MERPRHVYPANPYNTIYLRKMFSKIEERGICCNGLVLVMERFSTWSGLFSEHLMVM